MKNIKIKPAVVIAYVRPKISVLLFSWTQRKNEKCGRGLSGHDQSLFWRQNRPSSTTAESLEWSLDGRAVVAAAVGTIAGRRTADRVDVLAGRVEVGRRRPRGARAAAADGLRRPRDECVDGLDGLDAAARAVAATPGRAAAQQHAGDDKDDEEDEERNAEPDRQTDNHARHVVTYRPTQS